MHLPDGYLNVPVTAAAAIATTAAVGVALRRLSSDETEDPQAPAALPLMGVVAAFVFTAQMFNFPVLPGVSGHLLGATLATAVLGPWRGMVVMSVVLGIQMLLFADGGVAALGANILNMGVAGCLLSSLLLGLARSERPWLRWGAVALTAWCSVMLGAALAAGELAASGVAAARLIFPAMLGVHAVIGVGEATVTVAALRLLLGARPALRARLDEPVRFARHEGGEVWRVAAVLALSLLTVRLAVPSPDGLEFVAQRQGFEQRAAAGHALAPLPDYTLPGREPAGFDWLGSYLSAGLGMAACAGLMFGVGIAARPRRRVAAA